MSTQGVVDLLFCIDASQSMQPCIDAVRNHVLSFVRGLESGLQQRKVDIRLDFLAHSCGEDNGLFRMQTVRTQSLETALALYSKPRPDAFFTSDVAEFERALSAVQVAGDEATLVALDFALDFPWRSRRNCHRVVICLTDEAFESGALVEEQRRQLDALIDKVQALGIMLFLVAPASDVWHRLAEIDKSEFKEVSEANNGLQNVNFEKVLEHIGKSVSAASLQAAGDDRVPRALFGQDAWGGTSGTLTGR
jgi:hypothetical protein